MLHSHFCWRQSLTHSISVLMSLSAFLSSPVPGVTKPLGQKGPSSVVLQSMDSGVWWPGFEFQLHYSFNFPEWVNSPVNGSDDLELLRIWCVTLHKVPRTVPGTVLQWCLLNTYVDSKFRTGQPVHALPSHGQDWPGSVPLGGGSRLTCPGCSCGQRAACWGNEPLWPEKSPAVGSSHTFLTAPSLAHPTGKTERKQGDLTVQLFLIPGATAAVA